MHVATLPASAFVTGTNVISVELHQVQPAGTWTRHGAVFPDVQGSKSAVLLIQSTGRQPLLLLLLSPGCAGRPDGCAVRHAAAAHDADHAR